MNLNKFKFTRLPDRGVFRVKDLPEDWRERKNGIEKKSPFTDLISKILREESTASVAPYLERFEVYAPVTVLDRLEREFKK